MDRSTTETLGQMVAAQSVLTDPMRAALAQHGPSVAVEVVRKDTPFGTFVIGWKVVDGSALSDYEGQDGNLLTENQVRAINAATDTEPVDCGLANCDHKNGAC